MLVRNRKPAIYGALGGFSMLTLVACDALKVELSAEVRTLLFGLVGSSQLMLGLSSRQADVTSEGTHVPPKEE